MRTLKQLLESTQEGVSPTLDEIRARFSSSGEPEDDDSYMEEGAALASVAGATKKKTSAASKAKETKKSSPEPKIKETKEAPTKPKTTKASSASTKSTAKPSDVKKSTYAKSLETGPEWEEGPVKKISQYSPPEPVAKSASSPASPAVEPKVPSVNTAPTQAVAEDAMVAAKQTPSVSSVTQQAAEAIEPKPSLPASKTFGEPIYGDASPIGGATSVADDVAAKSPLLQKLMLAASGPTAKKLLLGTSIAGTIASLYGGEGEGPEPNDPYLNPPKPVNYTPASTEKSDLVPQLSSSKYDSVGSIVSDATRPVIPKEESLAPVARTISAGEPTAAVVKNQQRKIELTPSVGESAAKQISEYETLLDRYNAAKAKEEERLRDVNLQEAVDLISSGRAGIKPDTERYEKLRERIYKDTEKEESVKEEAEMRDPKSLISKQWREAAALAGITLSGNESASILKQTMPFLQKRVEGEENRAARLQEFQLRMADLNFRKDENQASKRNTFIQALRKETTSGAIGKLFSNYNTATKMKKALAEFSKNPSGYTDYATLMGGLKVLQGDDSVVRESEVRLGMNAASLSTKVKNWANRLVTGKSLSKEQRDEFVKTVQILSEKAREQYTDAISPVLKQAEAEGIDKKFLVSQGFLSEDEVAPVNISEDRIEAAAKEAGMKIEDYKRFLKGKGLL